MTGPPVIPKKGTTMTQENAPRKSEAAEKLRRYAKLKRSGDNLEVIMNGMADTAILIKGLAEFKDLDYSLLQWARDFAPTARGADLWTDRDLSVVATFVTLMDGIDVDPCLLGAHEKAQAVLEKTRYEMDDNKNASAEERDEAWYDLGRALVNLAEELDMYVRSDLKELVYVHRPSADDGGAMSLEAQRAAVRDDARRLGLVVQADEHHASA